MDKRTDSPNDNNFEVIYDHFDKTEEFSTSINSQENLHVNKIDNIYNYSYENLNSSPQERMIDLDKAEPDTNFNYVNSRLETRKNFNKQRKKKQSNFLKYFLTGLICSLISIFLSVAIMLYIIPDSKLYKNSLLSKELDSKIDTKVSSAIEDVGSDISQIDTGSQSNGLTSMEIASIVSPAVVGISNGSTHNFYPTESFGSGVIFREDGYILTNYHVVENATNNMVQVVFYDEQTTQAKIVNFDKNLDIAVLKVDNYAMPGVATLGDSSILKTGEQAYAFGSPLGRQYLGSVSAGIISSPSRLISVSQNNEAVVIQTDAAINFGNSGGPLVNSMAQVIGINSSKITEVNGTKVEGMGFAIPINEIKPLLDENIANNLIDQNPNIVYAADTTNEKGALLGVYPEYISGDLAKERNCPEGLYITNTIEGMPAKKAGIKPGDVIISIDGKKITSTNEVREIIQDMKSGDKITVQIQENLNVPPKNVIVTF